MLNHKVSKGEYHVYQSEPRRENAVGIVFDFNSAFITASTLSSTNQKEYIVLERFHCPGCGDSTIYQRLYQFQPGKPPSLMEKDIPVENGNLPGVGRSIEIADL